MECCGIHYSIGNIFSDAQHLFFPCRTGKGKQKDHNSLAHATIVLKEFLEGTQGDLDIVKADHKAAKEAYEKAVEFFSDNVKQTSPQSFFGTFARFTVAFKKAIEVRLCANFFPVTSLIFVHRM